MRSDFFQEIYVGLSLLVKVFDELKSKQTKPKKIINLFLEIEQGDSLRELTPAQILNKQTNHSNWNKIIQR